MIKAPAPPPPGSTQNGVNQEVDLNEEEQVLSTYNAIVYTMDHAKKWKPVMDNYVKLYCIDHNGNELKDRYSLVVVGHRKKILEHKIFSSTEVKIKDSFVRLHNEFETIGVRFTNPDAASKFNQRLVDLVTELSPYAKINKKMKQNIVGSSILEQSPSPLNISSLVIPTVKKEIHTLNIQISSTDTSTQFQAATDISLKEILQNVCATNGLDVDCATLHYSDMKYQQLTLSAIVSELKSKNLKLVTTQDRKKSMESSSKLEKLDKKMAKSGGRFGLLFSKSKIDTKPATSYQDNAELKVKIDDPEWRAFFDLANLHVEELKSSHVCAMIEDFVQERGGFLFLRQVNDQKMSPQLADDLNVLAGQVHMMSHSPSPEALSESANATDMQRTSSMENIVGSPTSGDTTTLDRKRNKRRAPPPPGAIKRAISTGDLNEDSGPTYAHIKDIKAGMKIFQHTTASPNGKRRAPVAPGDQTPSPAGRRRDKPPPIFVPPPPPEEPPPEDNPTTPIGPLSPERVLPAVKMSHEKTSKAEETKVSHEETKVSHEETKLLHEVTNKAEEELTLDDFDKMLNMEDGADENDASIESEKENTRAKESSNTVDSSPVPQKAERVKKSSNTVDSSPVPQKAERVKKHKKKSTDVVDDGKPQKKVVEIKTVDDVEQTTTEQLVQLQQQIHVAGDVQNSQQQQFLQQQVLQLQLQLLQQQQMLLTAGLPVLTNGVQSPVIATQTQAPTAPLQSTFSAAPVQQEEINPSSVNPVLPDSRIDVTSAKPSVTTKKKVMDSAVSADPVLNDIPPPPNYSPPSVPKTTVAKSSALREPTTSISQPEIETSNSPADSFVLTQPTPKPIVQPTAAKRPPSGLYAKLKAKTATNGSNSPQTTDKPPETRNALKSQSTESKPKVIPIAADIKTTVQACAPKYDKSKDSREPILLKGVVVPALGENKKQPSPAEETTVDAESKIDDSMPHVNKYNERNSQMKVEPVSKQITVPVNSDKVESTSEQTTMKSQLTQDNLAASSPSHVSVNSDKSELVNEPIVAKVEPVSRPITTAVKSNGSNHMFCPASLKSQSGKVNPGAVLSKSYKIEPASEPPVAPKVSTTVKNVKNEVVTEIKRPDSSLPDVINFPEKHFITVSTEAVESTHEKAGELSRENAVESTRDNVAISTIDEIVKSTHKNDEGSKKPKNVEEQVKKSTSASSQIENYNPNEIIKFPDEPQNKTSIARSKKDLVKLPPSKIQSEVEQRDEKFAKPQPKIITKETSVAPNLISNVQPSVLMTKEQPKANSKDQEKVISYQQPMVIINEQPKITRDEPSRIVKKEQPKITRDEPSRIVKNEQPKITRDEPSRIVKNEQPKITRDEPSRVVKNEQPKVTQDEPSRIVKNEQPKITRDEPSRVVKNEQPKVTRDEPSRVVKNEQPKITRDEPSRVVKNEQPKVTRDEPSRIVKNEQPKITRDEPSRVVKNKQPKVTRDEPSRIVKNEQQKVSRDEPSRVVKNELPKITRDEPSKIVKTEQPKIARDEPSRVVKNEQPKIMRDEPSRVVKYEQLKITRDEPSRIVKKEQSKITPDEPSRIVKNEQPKVLRKEQPAAVNQRAEHAQVINWQQISVPTSLQREKDIARNAQPKGLLESPRDRLIRSIEQSGIPGLGVDSADSKVQRSYGNVDSKSQMLPSPRKGIPVKKEYVYELPKSKAVPLDDRNTPPGVKPKQQRQSSKEEIEPCITANSVVANTSPYTRPGTLDIVARQTTTMKTVAGLKLGFVDNKEPTVRSRQTNFVKQLVQQKNSVDEVDNKVLQPSTDTSKEEEIVTVKPSEILRAKSHKRNFSRETVEVNNNNDVIEPNKNSEGLGYTDKMSIRPSEVMRARSRTQGSKTQTTAKIHLTRTQSSHTEEGEEHNVKPSELFGLAKTLPKQPKIHGNVTRNENIDLRAVSK